MLFRSQVQRPSFISIACQNGSTTGVPLLAPCPSPRAWMRTMSPTSRRFSIYPVVGHRLEHLVPPPAQPVVSVVPALHLHEPGLNRDVAVHQTPERFPVATVEGVVRVPYLLDGLLGHPARSITDTASQGEPGARAARPRRRSGRGAQRHRELPTVPVVSVGRMPHRPPGARGSDVGRRRPATTGERQHRDRDEQPHARSLHRRESGRSQIPR